jgi:8-oxo-dGTP diphosphatase
LHTREGESPYACACREAAEELRLKLRASDLHLTGLVSEHGYLGQAHWLMFLFEVKPRLRILPPPNREGIFRFYPRRGLRSVRLPDTDRTVIWPLFWKHRRGFFAAHWRNEEGRVRWRLEESCVA